MDFAQKVFHILTTDPAVAALIGARCYPVIMPERPTFPLITYSQIDADPTYSQEGNSGLTFMRIQMSCWAEGYDEVRQLAAAVERAVAKWPATFGESAEVVHVTDLWDGATGVYHRPVDVMIGDRS